MRDALTRYAARLQPPPHWLEPREEEPRPVFSEPVVGYRQWRVDAYGRLRALSNYTRWQPGVNRAVCFRALPSAQQQWSDRHPAPHRGCECGLYAWHRPQTVATRFDPLDLTPFVQGSVACWGEVLVHWAGYRAEHACVTALAVPAGASPSYREVVEQVAQRYRVPVVQARDLHLEAGRHGAPLPDWVRPPMPRSAA